MPRDLRPSGFVLPPLAYAGERERLVDERNDLLLEIKGLPPASRCRAGLEHRLRRVTTRLLALGKAPAPVPGTDRKDLQ